MTGRAMKMSLWGTAAVGVLMGLAAAPAEARPGLDPDQEVERVTRDETDRLSRDRLAYPAYFAEAYRRYPQLPEGVLEAVAFVGSRWSHRIPEAPFDGHHNMPQAYGIMGLYRGNGGFRDVVAEAAGALGVSEEAVIGDVRTNILATAALLSRYVEDEGLEHPLLEEMGPVLARLSGLPGGTNVTDFARNAYVFDVLLSLDRGHDDHGIRIRDREVVWELVFDGDTLELMRAPMVRIAAEEDIVELPGGVRWMGGPGGGLERRKARPGASADAGTADLAAPGGAAEKSAPESTDYGPALWVASPNYSSRNGTKITHVAIHTVQGSYSGCISWFQNPDSDVSAHYVIRSSDGQVTQMVRESNKAWHIGSENPYTLGTEHEGYVSTSSYYTTAMYNSSAALTKDMCKSNGIDCSTCYGGSSSASVQVLSSSYRVKGHQHYPNQTHTDPGQYWSWSKYKSLVAGTSGGDTGGGDTGGSTTSSKVLDSFESSEGHFNTSPTYSGSTTGISSSSTAERTTSMRKNGSYSERLMLLDNSSSSSSWQVRFLSGSGSASQNVALTKSGGRIGFWVYTGASSIQMAVTVDDGSASEVSTKKSVPVNSWTYLEWKLDDAAQWDSFYNGNGQLDASSVTLDAIMVYRAQTSYTVYVYIDDVTYKR